MIEKLIFLSSYLAFAPLDAKNIESHQKSENLAPKTSQAFVFEVREVTALVDSALAQEQNEITPQQKMKQLITRVRKNGSERSWGKILVVLYTDGKDSTKYDVEIIYELNKDRASETDTTSVKLQEIIAHVLISKRRHGTEGGKGKIAYIDGWGRTGDPDGTLDYLVDIEKFSKLDKEYGDGDGKLDFIMSNFETRSEEDRKAFEEVIDNALRGKIIAIK